MPSHGIALSPLSQQIVHEIRYRDTEIMLLLGNGMPSCINSPRSVHATSFLRRSINRLALVCMVLGTAAAAVHQDHARRLSDASVGQGVVPLEDLIVQLHHFPVVQIGYFEDGSHVGVESSHDLTDGVRRRRRSKGLQQPRIHQGQFTRVLHVSTSTVVRARGQEPCSPTGLGRPTGSHRSVGSLSSFWPTSSSYTCM